MTCAAEASISRVTNQQFKTVMHTRAIEALSESDVSTQHAGTVSKNSKGNELDHCRACTLEHTLPDRAFRRGIRNLTCEDGIEALDF